MGRNEMPFGHPEDLIAELDLKLTELLSHVKLLANSTGFARDYEIYAEDINALSTTIHDKVLNIIILEQQLKNALNNTSLN